MKGTGSTELSFSLVLSVDSRSLRPLSLGLKVEREVDLVLNLRGVVKSKASTKYEVVIKMKVKNPKIISDEDIEVVVAH